MTRANITDGLHVGLCDLDDKSHVFVRLRDDNGELTAILTLAQARNVAAKITKWADVLESGVNLRGLPS